MKTSIFASLLIFSAIFLSCNKDSDASASTTVEYQISPMNVYFTEIKYTDQNGNPVVITDPADFASGKKSISVSSKPFNAKLETALTNTTSSTVYYTLVISTDGEVKKTVSATAPPMASTTSSIEFAVQ